MSRRKVSLDEPLSPVLALHEEYLAAVKTRDAESAAQVIDRAIELAIPLRDIYSGIVLKAYDALRALKDQGAIVAGDEQLASQLALSELVRLRRLARPHPSRGLRCAVAALSRDRSLVHARALADYLHMDGWRSQLIGELPPAEELISLIQGERVSLLAIWSAEREMLAASAPTIKALRERSVELRILAVGPGLGDNADQSRQAGADMAVNAPEDAVQAAVELFNLRPNTQSLEGYLSGLGERIQRFRKVRRMNQQSVADRAQLDRTYLSSVENGKQNVSISALLRIAKALEVEFEDLLVERAAQARY